MLLNLLIHATELPTTSAKKRRGVKKHRKVSRKASVNSGVHISLLSAGYQVSTAGVSCARRRCGAGIKSVSDARARSSTYSQHPKGTSSLRYPSLRQTELEPLNRQVDVNDLCILVTCAQFADPLNLFLPEIKQPRM